MTELIERARSGDAEAFVRLMELHKQTLWKLARSYFRDEADAEDAVAETVLACWERLDTLRKPAYFKTWLVRVLINNCNDIVRRRRRLLPLDALPEAAEAVEDAHDGLDFEELLGALSPRLRPVLLLYYGEGYKAREIAAILRIPVGTVTSRLKRGRQQLAAYAEKRGIQP